MKKVLCVVFCLMLIMSNCTIVFAQTNDYENNWAKNEIDYVKSKGIIDGYPDGTFRPDNNISKVEFYKIINKMMGFTHKSEVNFSDVIPGAWYYDEVAKGLGANYITLSEFLNPDEKISRGEVARILGIVFEVEGDKLESAKFADSANIPEELKAVIGGLKKSGYINGYPDGTFRIDGEITRAEAVKMLHNISGEIVNKKETVDKIENKNLLVNTEDVNLKNIEVEGNLYLTEGIGEGSIYLDNVKVKNMTMISGGGTDTIEVKNSELKSLLVNKKHGPVKVEFLNTKIETAKSINQAKLHLKAESHIKNLELKDKAELIFDKNSSIDKLSIISGDISISGQGTINYIKSEVKFTVNGTEAKANTEYKFASGKLSELNQTSSPGGGFIPNPDPNPDPGPGPQPPKVNKEELIKVINEAKNKVKADYTEESWKQFAQALQEAETVRDNESSTQGQVDTAMEKLKNSMNSLVKKPPVDPEEPVDPEPTIKALYHQNFINYFPFISVKVENVKGAARFSVEYYIDGLDNNPKLVQSKIFNLDEKTTMIFYDPSKYETVDIFIYDVNNVLLHKFEGVVLVSDKETVKEDLRLAIEEAQTKDKNIYTEESWTVFEEALEEAIKVYENPNATQLQVDTALNELNVAIESLVQKEDVPPIPEITVKYYPNGILINLVQISVNIKNLEGASQYDVEFNTSDKEDGTPNLEITNKVDIDKRIHIWYDLASKYRTVTIRVYDANDNLLHTFENVRPIRAE